VAGAGIGLFRSAGLKKRERLLSEMIGLFENMAVQIRYRALPLQDLFNLYNNNEFILMVNNQMQISRNVRTAWKDAVCAFPEFDDGDKELLISVGGLLGNSDTDGQVAMLEMNKNLLGARLKEASENLVKKGAMYRSVGFLSGLALAVIVI